jgi:carbonic anhydrase
MQKMFTSDGLRRDFVAGIVVFLVALPLCLGIALASNAPLVSGLVSGIVGGLVVAWLSGSHTSVSGPAAGLTVVIATQIAILGSFDAFLVAVMLAGLMQIALGAARAGFISSFFPNSVIKGLLAAIGLILIFKQIPHLVGHDVDPEGDFAFLQVDGANTITELFAMLSHIHIGAAAVGLLSLALLVYSPKNALTQKLPLALWVVGLGIVLTKVFEWVSGPLFIDSTHLVQVPIAHSLSEFTQLFQIPSFEGMFARYDVWMAAATIAAVASIETLLNIEAVDKLDPRQRVTPANRELFAQGVGNTICGLIGGLPMTSVVVRSSVNLQSNNETKLSAFFHGILLLVCVALVPSLLNSIPLAALAAILIVTGFKLTPVSLYTGMYRQGYNQFIPFATTVLAIFFTDLLTGVLAGLVVALAFILKNNYQRPTRQITEQRLDTDVLRVELPTQLSFLARASLIKTLNSFKAGEHVLIDATRNRFMDTDIADVIYDFIHKSAPARGVVVSTQGFTPESIIKNKVLFLDCSTKELQSQLNPQEIVKKLMDGHRRFKSGRSLQREFAREVSQTQDSQHPLAVVLGCIDSRAPAEILFDTGIGDIFTARVAGNVVSRKIIGSIEYAVAVAGAKVIMVLGHTKCGAVASSVDFAAMQKSVHEVTQCENIDIIVDEIKTCMDYDEIQSISKLDPKQKSEFVNEVAQRNVEQSMARLLKMSTKLRSLVESGSVALVGALYDVSTGDLQFLRGADLDENSSRGDLKQKIRYVSQQVKEGVTVK